MQHTGDLKITKILWGRSSSLFIKNTACLGSNSWSFSLVSQEREMRSASEYELLNHKQKIGTALVSMGKKI